MQIPSFDSVVTAVYETAAGPDVWSDVLCNIADFCGGANAALVYDYRQSGFSGVVTPRADPAIVAEYRQHWWKYNPVIESRTRPGVIRSLDDCGREAYYASAFHNEFWRRTGLGAERLVANIVNDSQRHCSMILQASVQHDEVVEETRKRFERLVPHVIRAIEIGSRLKKLDFDLWLDNRGDKGSDMIVFGVGADHGLVYANVMGERMLGKGAPFTIREGRLHLAGERNNAALSHAINQCISGRASAMMRLQVASECDRNRVYKVCVTGCLGSTPRVPVPGVLALVLIDEEIDEAELKLHVLRTSFGLTKAEARLTLEILGCDGRAAAARRCGISPNTARTHLSRIFDKIGVNKQVQLVTVVRSALVSRSPTPRP